MSFYKKLHFWNLLRPLPRCLRTRKIRAMDRAAATQGATSSLIVYHLLQYWFNQVSADTKWRDVHLYKIVIDRSMTVSADSKWRDVHIYKSVIDW